MLIDFLKSVKRLDINVKGVIHVGAHWGQEYDVYKDCGASHCVFIEPCKEALRVLRQRLAAYDDVIIYNCACSDHEGNEVMNVSNANQGMSNSLLKPVKHLEYYPEIPFMEGERVPVRTLDSLPITRERYNVLAMDVQGAELLVLKGAVQTLKHIDCIYTEVNDEELYEGCARVSELDAFLYEFTRTESKWVSGKGWGDAIYVRKYSHGV